MVQSYFVVSEICLPVFFEAFDRLYQRFVDPSAAGFTGFNFQSQNDQTTCEVLILIKHFNHQDLGFFTNLGLVIVLFKVIL